MHDEAKTELAPARHAVVIAGAGPAGLMLAGELALAQVDVALVEPRDSHQLAGLRAGGLHMRTLELLDQRGIAERFLAKGQRFHGAPFAKSMLDISDVPTRHNYFLALAQTQIERILSEWIAALQVPIYRGRSVTAFAQDEHGVDIALSDGRSLRAKYLVGCDGGRSLVRKQAGIAFPGWDPSTSYLIAEVELGEEPPWGIRRGDKGIYALGKIAGEGGVRVVLCEQDVREREQPTLDDLRALLIAVYGTDYGLRSASYLSRFTDMARQAASYRERRVLLAGDAAHVHSPVGGQGLNLGLQDAMNLGWKLAQVIHGSADESLLDSYHNERHPQGARVLRNTLALTALDRGDARSEALRELTSELLRVDQARQHYVAMISGLDVRYELGAGHALLGRRMPDLELDMAGGPRRVYSLLHEGRPLLLSFAGAFDITPWAHRVRQVDARYRGAWELPAVGVVAPPAAVLIRPDGYVAWVGEGTEQGLHDALRAWCGAARQSA
ncbi:MAG TPA: FAD-dependent monooxygenase [Polyangiales bacterium]